MNKSFYQLYKSCRDLIYDFNKPDLGSDERYFLELIKSDCEKLDEYYSDYLNKWQNERFLLFRFHRGGLDESMKTIKIISSSMDLKNLIFEACDIQPTNITILPYLYDPRIQWDTHVVLIHMGDKSYQVGYLNKKPEWDI
jgi:hypothetical protein